MILAKTLFVNLTNCYKPAIKLCYSPNTYSDRKFFTGFTNAARKD